jgi:hypothetical protein
MPVACTEIAEIMPMPSIEALIAPRSLAMMRIYGRAAIQDPPSPFVGIVLRELTAYVL